MSCVRLGDLPAWSLQWMLPNFTGTAQVNTGSSVYTDIMAYLSDRIMKLWLTGAWLALFTGLVFADTSSLDLPDIGDSAGSLLSPEHERRLGNAFLRQVRQRAPVVYDPEVEEYINTLGFKLASNSDNSSQPFTFFVIKDPLVNAFAGPGGVIGMHSGVILNSESESELAAVMAHEIAHVTQRHLVRFFEEADRMSLPMAAAIIGAIIVGTQNSQAGAAALAATAGLNIQNQINFTRANEQEADRIGMQILQRADFDPRGMPAFFERLQQASKYYQGNAPEFLRTHPLTNNRVADSRARADAFPQKEVKDSKSYLQVRAKLRVQSFADPKDAIAYFTRVMRETEGNIDHLRYGYALALTEAGEYVRAKENLKQLLKKDETNVAYLIALGDIEKKRGNYRNSLIVYQEAYKYYSDYRPLVLNYSKALLDAGQPDEARKILRRYGSANEADITYYHLLSQAEGQTGSQIESGIAKAEYYYLLGDTELAIKRLELARTQGTPDYYQKERIDARLAQLNYERELEKDLEL